MTPDDENEAALGASVFVVMGTGVNLNLNLIGV